MNKKLKKMALGMTAGAMLLVGTAFAAEAAPLGKNMTGEGLGQGQTKYFIADFLMMDPFQIRADRREGLSMVEIAEKQGVQGDVLIDAVLQFRSENMPAECTIEDVREKVTANLNKASMPRANANPMRMQAGESFGERVEGQMRGQARGWQR